MSPVGRIIGHSQVPSSNEGMSSSPPATAAGESSSAEARRSSHRGMGTRAVHLGHGAEPLTGAIMPPIILSTTFEQRAPGVPISVSAEHVDLSDKLTMFHAHSALAI